MQETESMSSEISRIVAMFEDAAMAMGPAAQAAGGAMRKFGDAFYLCAERAYLEAHSRLPGSGRSPRFLKKRQDLVLKWYFDNFTQPASPQS
jgi:hypothetical protein